MTDTLVCERVAHREGTVRLRGISFRASRGVVALLGSNDDGAELLLDVLAGVTRPQRGQATVNGTPPSSASSRRSIGWVPRRPYWPDHLSVREALSLAMAVRGDGALEMDPRMKALLHAAVASRRMASLSNEERRSLAFVEAVASASVRLVVIDQPHRDMDSGLSGDVRAQIHQKVADGASVVFRTDSVDVAATLADHCVVLLQGNVIFSGPSRAMLDGKPSCLRLVVASPAEFAMALREAPVVRSVRAHGPTLIVEGGDERILAKAVIDVADAHDLEVLAMAPQCPSLVDIQGRLQKQDPSKEVVL